MMRAITVFFLLLMVGCYKPAPQTPARVVFASTNEFSQDERVVKSVVSLIAEQFGDKQKIESEFVRFPIERADDREIAARIAASRPAVVIAASEDEAERIIEHDMKLPIVAFMNRRLPAPTTHGLNFTGFLADVSLEERRIQLLASCLQKGDDVALMVFGPTEANEQRIAKIVRSAETSGLRIKILSIASTAGPGDVKKLLAGSGVNGLYMFMTPLSNQERGRAAELTAGISIPIIYEHTLFVREGAQLAIDADPSDNLKVLSRLAAQVIRGVPPAALPVETPKRIRVSASVAGTRLLSPSCRSELAPLVTEWHP